MREFTPEELAEYNGKNGKPAYIACNTVVYDVTDSFLWRGGRHQALHSAGKDLTDEINDAPHGPDLLERVVPVGVLIEGKN